ncbi:hypothetical protein SASPL_133309 [Salvia splendens]|uniref:Uncharacterized protein n=1 Tax=Salvia splendens TaxID=180675 RepID=A0A8X8ZHZ5_SALSN|nr:hypothetical protein SASPL_133309 [Salvia splendens]
MSTVSSLSFLGTGGVRLDMNVLIHEIDSVILGTLIRLKHATGCEGTVFPSHFIFKAKIAIENQLAYYQCSDPAYNQLYELFALNAIKEERENTVILLTDSFQSQGHVCVGSDMNAPPVDTGEVNSYQRLSLTRRKLMFDEGGLLDCESTNKKVVCFYIPDANVKLERKVEKKHLVYYLESCHPRVQHCPTRVHHPVRSLSGGCHGSPTYNWHDKL